MCHFQLRDQTIAHFSLGYGLVTGLPSSSLHLDLRTPLSCRRPECPAVSPQIFTNEGCHTSFMLNLTYFISNVQYLSR